MNAISHFFFKTPFGQAAIIYTNSPFLLKAVCLPRPTTADVVAHMKRYRHGCERFHPAADRVAGMIVAYFNGEPCTVPWHLLDTAHWTPAQASVYASVAQIPYGEVRSYGAIARDSGRPNAARFVGNCMARNPFPVFVPCHRVVASDGRLGGFGGGLDLKRKMLELEGFATVAGVEVRIKSHK
jgi:methylated-DNA-[protein]-cysteine S-methyltransferase